MFGPGVNTTIRAAKAKNKRSDSGSTAFSSSSLVISACQDAPHLGNRQEKSMMGKPPLCSIALLAGHPGKGTSQPRRDLLAIAYEGLFAKFD
ncbi:hypothetical protein [Billgrantia lactosivorans]|uniref:hypothetical protein n=1 Tax=Billgrantia lactosivorans TaxID=2185141 RepID=UPI0013A6C68E|nr:hypothetical protein [Halomonas lactosivorans]